jgi:hypothetical protein
MTSIHMYMNILQCNCRAIPLLSAFPFSIPLCFPFRLPLLTWNPLAVIGSCPPRSQVARKLIFPFPSPSPYTPHSEILTPPPGSPRSKYTFIRTTSRTWLTRSRTVCQTVFSQFIKVFVALYLLILSILWWCFGNIKQLKKYLESPDNTD